MTKMVRELPGEYFTLTEAARALGKSKRTLRSWIYNDVEGLQPGKRVDFGNAFAWVYSRQDIERIKRNLRNRVVVRDYRRQSRKSKYTEDQSKERSRLMSSRWYWKKVRRRAEFIQDRKAFAKAQVRLDMIDAEMEEIKKEAS